MTEMNRWNVTFQKEPETLYEKEMGPISDDTDPDHLSAIAVYKICQTIINEPDVESAINKLMSKLEDLGPEDISPVQGAMYNWLCTLAAVEDGDYR